MERIEGLDHNLNLTELWLNRNHIQNHDTLAYLSKFKSLETIYLSDNPIARIPEVMEHLQSAVPSLKEIDGTLLKPGFKYIVKLEKDVKPITKKGINPDAKKILQ